MVVPHIVWTIKLNECKDAYMLHVAGAGGPLAWHYVKTVGPGPLHRYLWQHAAQLPKTRALQTQNFILMNTLPQNFDQ